jgi:hypothetical protein
MLLISPNVLMDDLYTGMTKRSVSYRMTDGRGLLRVYPEQ